MNIAYAIVKIFSLVVHLALGGYALQSAPRRRLNQAFLLATTSIAVMELGYSMLLMHPESVLWMRIALVGQCLASGNTVLFSLIYGREYWRSTRSEKLYLIPVYSACLMLMVAILVGAVKFTLTDVLVDEASSTTQTGAILVFSRLGLLFFVFLLICALVTLVNFENVYRQGRHAGRRVTYPAIVFIAALSFHLLIYSWALGFSYMRMGILTVASITLIIANGCIAYPVTRPQPRGTVRVGPAVIARSYTMLLASIYLLVIGLLGKIVQVIGRNLNFLLASLVAFFVLLLIIAIILSKSLKQRFQTSIRRSIYRSIYDYRDEWEKFSRRVFSILSIRGLIRAVQDTVADTIGAENVCVMLLDEMRGEFSALDMEHSAPDGAGETDTAMSIPAEDGFLGWLWRYGKPVQIDGGQCKASETFSEPPPVPKVLLSVMADQHPAISEPETDGQEMGVEQATADVASGVCAPIIAEHELIAVMILGSRMTSPYSQEDIDLLETMANQISIAIMNANTSH